MWQGGGCGETAGGPLRLDEGARRPGGWRSGQWAGQGGGFRVGCHCWSNREPWRLAGREEQSLVLGWRWPERGVLGAAVEGRAGMEGGRRGSTMCLLPHRLGSSGDTPSPSTRPGQDTGRTPGGPGPRPAGLCDPVPPLARAGSGLLPRNPKDGLFPPESGPQGLRPQGLVVSGSRSPTYLESSLS